MATYSVLGDISKKERAKFWGYIRPTTSPTRGSHSLLTHTLMNLPPRLAATPPSRRRGIERGIASLHVAVFTDAARYVPTWGGLLRTRHAASLHVNYG